MGDGKYKVRSPYRPADRCYKLVPTTSAPLFDRLRLPSDQKLSVKCSAYYPNNVTKALCANKAHNLIFISNFKKRCQLLLLAKTFFTPNEQLITFFRL